MARSRTDVGVHHIRHHGLATRNSSFAKAPPRAPGTGRYSTSKSSTQHLPTFRQKGELSYSYTIMGLDGRAAETPSCRREI